MDLARKNKTPGQGQCGAAARALLEEPPAKEGEPAKDKTSATTVIMIVIAINTCTDAWAGARPDEGSVEFKTKFWVNNVCLIFYLAEALLKVVAYGLWGPPDAYLKRAWCVFDLVVITSMIVDLGLYLSNGGDGVSLQFFRVLRALKPIRSAKGFENLRVIVETIAQGARRFAATAIASSLFTFAMTKTVALGFQIMLAAVFGVNLWGLSGDLHRYCTVLVPSGQELLGVAENESSLSMHAESPIGSDHEQVIAVPAVHCSSTAPGYGCDEGQTCAESSARAPMDGLHSLDDVGHAMLTVWTVSLRDTFSFVLHHTSRVAGPWATLAYYIVIVVFGFALLNYFTAFYVLGYMERLKRFEITEFHTDTQHLAQPDPSPAASRAQPPPGLNPRDPEAAAAAQRPGPRSAEALAHGDGGSLRASVGPDMGHPRRGAPGPASPPPRGASGEAGRAPDVVGFCGRVPQYLAALAGERGLRRLRGWGTRVARACELAARFPHLSAADAAARPGGGRTNLKRTSLPWLEIGSILATLAQVAVWLFVLMLVVKVIGRAEWFRPMHSPLEIMDLCVTTFSAFIWLLNVFVDGAAIRDLSTMRFIRVLSLLFYLPALRLLIQQGLKSMTHSLSALVVVVFLWVTFSLLAQQLFSQVELAEGGSMHPLPRIKAFETFLSSMYMILQILTATSVPHIMRGSAAEGGVLVLFVVLCAVFLSLLGNKTFLAILIDNLEREDSDKVFYQLLDEENATELQLEENRQQLLKENIANGRTFNYDKFGFLSETTDMPGSHLGARALAGPGLEEAVGFRGWTYLLALTSTDPPTLYWSELLHRDTMQFFTGPQISLSGCTISHQSAIRSRQCEQPTPFAIVLVPKINRKQMRAHHRSFVLWLPSRYALSQLLQELKQGGCSMGAKVESMCTPPDDGMALVKRDSRALIEGGSETEEAGEPLWAEEKTLAASFWKTVNQVVRLARKDTGVNKNKALKLAARKRHSRFRVFLEHPWFEPAMIVLIVCFVVLTSMEIATEEGPFALTKTNLLIIEMTFIGVYTGELILKGYCYGLVGPDPDALLLRWWNYVDIGALILACTDVAFSLTSGRKTGLKSIRLMRLLRPLTTSGKTPRMAAIIHSVWNARMNMTQVFLGACCIAGVCGMACMELYGGRMAFCSDLALSHHACVGVSLREATTLRDSDLTNSEWLPTVARQPILVPRAWTTCRLNFDDWFNMGRSMLSVAVPYSVGWTSLADDIIHVNVHEASGGLDPHFHRVLSIWPMVLCLFVMHVVVYNFLIAVLISSIRDLNGHANSTRMQRSWQATCRLLHRSNPAQVRDKLQVAVVPSVRRLISAPWFEGVTHGLIVLHFLILASAHYGQTPWWNQTLRGLGTATVSAMCVEQILRLVAHGPHQVFRNARTFAELLVTLAAALEGFLLERPSLIAALRCMALWFEVKSLTRLVPALSDLDSIFASLPEAFSMSLGCLFLLALWVAIFTIIGVQFFGGLHYSRDGITPDSNFNGYGSAVSLCLRLCLGESYIATLDDMMRSPPACTPDPAAYSHIEPDERGKLVNAITGRFVPNYGDCGHPLAALYMFAMLVMARVAILPLFIASVISALIERMDDMRALIPWNQVMMFQKAWSRFDRDNSGCIPAWKLLPLCEQLLLDGCTLGLGGTRDREDFVRLRAAITQSMQEQRAEGAPLTPRDGNVPLRKQELSGASRLDYMTCIVQLVVLKTFPKEKQVIEKTHAFQQKLNGVLAAVNRQFCARVFTIVEYAAAAVEGGGGTNPAVDWVWAEADRRARECRVPKRERQLSSLLKDHAFVHVRGAEDGASRRQSGDCSLNAREADTTWVLQRGRPPLFDAEAVDWIRDLDQKFPALRDRSGLGWQLARGVLQSEEDGSFGPLRGSWRIRNERAEEKRGAMLPAVTQIADQDLLVFLPWRHKTRRRGRSRLADALSADGLETQRTLSSASHFVLDHDDDGLDSVDEPVRPPPMSRLPSHEVPLPTVNRRDSEETLEETNTDLDASIDAWTGRPPAALRPPRPLRARLPRSHAADSAAEAAAGAASRAPPPQPAEELRAALRRAEGRGPSSSPKYSPKTLADIAAEVSNPRTLMGIAIEISSPRKPALTLAMSARSAANGVPGNAQGKDELQSRRRLPPPPQRTADESAALAAELRRLDRQPAIGEEAGEHGPGPASHVWGVATRWISGVLHGKEQQ